MIGRHTEGIGGKLRFRRTEALQRGMEMRRQERTV